MKKIVMYTFALVLLFTFSTPMYAKSKDTTDQLIIINKKVNKLAFFNNGKLIKVFDVATGRQPSYTPEGLFPIVNKIKNRPYYSKNIKGGSPKNPLGDRWMGLQALGTNGTTYAIHVNNKESSIGTYASAGCIRMHNIDIRWLFDQVEKETNVYIVTSPKSFDDLVADYGYKVSSVSDQANKNPEVIAPKQTSEKVDINITLLDATPLYENAVDTSKLIITLTQQTLHAIQKTNDGWYQVETPDGNNWVKDKNVIVGDIVQETKDIELTKNYKIYKVPFTNTTSFGVLSPQTVTSFEQWNDWYHIHTWLGDMWIQFTT